MGDSAEPSGRFDFSAEDDSRIPSEDEEEKKRKSLGKKGKNTVGLAKMFKSQGKRSDCEDADLSDLQGIGIGIRRYNYMELHRATKGFSQVCQIGWGAFGLEPYGVVYKGVYEGQQAVAIKVLSRPLSHAISLYMTEIKVLSQMRHRNVVQLFGWCHQAGQWALVFEYVPNRRLADHLYGNHYLPPLPWKVRYSRIIVGLASALLYLQEGLDSFVIHRNIKPSNILLDSKFNPKLADFAISTVIERGDLEPEYLHTRVVGTPGYFDPHYYSTGNLSKGSDIYGFGVVALQIASGRNVTIDCVEGSKHLPKWVEELHEKGRILQAVDPKLGGDFNEQEAERLLLIGLWCTQSDDKSRPSIKLILQLLNFEAPMPSNFINSVKGNVDANVEWARTSDSSPFTSSDTVQPIAPGEDSDATAASTEEKIIVRVEFKDDGGDDPLPILLQDVGKYEPLSEPILFNIGIPPNSGFAEIGHCRKEHHRHILKGFVGSLHEMMHSKDNLPRFDEALEKIKAYTTCLIQAIGPPLDDWNTLAQLVLQSLKEKEDLFKSSDDQESLVNNFIVPSLDTEHTLKEDKEKLEDVKERLVRARQICTNLAAELAEAQDISLSMEAEMKAIEHLIAEKRVLLEQRRKHNAFLEHYESVLFKLSSFTC